MLKVKSFCFSFFLWPTWTVPLKGLTRLTYVYIHVLCHIFTNKYILERRFLQAVLETIRDLMNTECIVPDWLHDIFLGYDDPGAAHYSRYINITWSHFTACVPLALLDLVFGFYEQWQ